MNCYIYDWRRSIDKRMKGMLTYQKTETVLQKHLIPIEIKWFHTNPFGSKFLMRNAAMNRYYVIEYTRHIHRSWIEHHIKNDGLFVVFKEDVPEEKKVKRKKKEQFIDPNQGGLF